MMKKIVIAAIAATSFSASATLPEDRDFAASWSLNMNNVPIVASTNYSMLSLISDGGVVAFIKLPRSSVEYCYDNSDDFERSIAKINGKSVNMIRYCFAKKYRFVAATQEGRDYIFNEFKTKNKVIAFGYTFTAKNFTKSYLKAITEKQNAL